MSNLLDKSSIVLTASAYDNGKVLCVKPSDGSGDFDFSRNSAATRVNAQGLVEDVQILSSNLVQNGSFSQLGSEEVTNGSFSQQGSQLVTNGDFATDSDWSLGANTTISSGALNFSTATSNTDQSLTTTNTKIYKVVFTISNYVSGSVRFRFTGTANVNGTTRNTNGTFTQYITATANNSIFRFAANSFTGSIDNVSVVEVGQDWNLGTGWSIGDNKASQDGSSTSFISQNGILVVGKTYKVQYTVLDYVSGRVRFRANGVNGSSNNTNGVVTDFIVAGGTQFALQGLDSFIGSVTNISVKEVGQNWTLGTGWSIGDNKATTDGTINSNIAQDGVTIIGKTYKYSFDVLDSGAGVIEGRFRNGGGFIANFSSEGTYTGTFVAYNTFADFTTLSGNTASFSITNISIIEITDDTNLPRISYENFSYQDALGSELVTGGDFSNPSDWVKATGTTISGGKLNITANSTNDRTRQNIGMVQNKTYKITFEISNYQSGNLGILFGGSSTPTIGTLNSDGSYSFIQENFGANSFFYFKGNLFIGSIDNVSVKEYKGQQVVPDSGCGSWLFEPQSTNLFTQSELFSDSFWIKSRSTFTDNATQSPSGVNNMGFLTEDTTASNTHYMRGFVTLTDGANYTLSVFAKAKERNIICLGDNAAAQSNTGVWFDLTNGVVLTQRSGYVGSIKDFGNGIYRCSVTYTASAARQYTDIALSLSDGVNVYTGNGTSGAYFWGAQVEQQSYATSYIPTDGTSVTRNQDVCTNGGSAATISSTSGTLYLDIAALSDDLTFRSISLNDGTNTNSVGIRYRTNSNRVNAIIKDGNGVTLQMNVDISDITQFNKIALRYKSGDVSMYINGTEVATNSLSFSFTVALNDLSFDRGDNNDKFFGKTKAVAVFPFLTDTELQELTTI